MLSINSTFYSIQFCIISIDSISVYSDKVSIHCFSEKDTVVFLIAQARQWDHDPEYERIVFVNMTISVNSYVLMGKKYNQLKKICQLVLLVMIMATIYRLSTLLGTKLDALCKFPIVLHDDHREQRSSPTLLINPRGHGKSKIPVPVFLSECYTVHSCPCLKETRPHHPSTTLSYGRFPRQQL